MRTKTIISIAVFWLLFFAAAKCCFAVACGEVSFAELAKALWYGLPIDLSTTAYFLSPVVLVVWVSVLLPRLPLQRILLPWHALCALCATTAVVVDASLYPFWGIKLDASVLAYIDSPTEALASVSVWFVVWRVMLAAALIIVTTLLLRKLTPTEVRPVSSWCNLMMPIICGLTFLAIRGGVKESTMNVGTCYHSQRMFMNHVAVNPLFSFIASASKTEDFAAMYNLLPEEECSSIFNTLYPPVESEDSDESDCALQIINHKTPNVLVILWESGGGSFFAPFGGTPDVMVNLERLADEGVLFSRMYSNSWRTDRGMVSALSGWFAYPTLTLMRLPVIADRLPCLGRSFASQGYDTFFMYGGDINFTHTAGYLTAGGYQTLIADRDFSLPEQRTEKWGVTDSITFCRLYDEVVKRSQSGHPWHGGMLTLSSHEPFKVPFRKHQNDVLNAMSYTDHCIGRFVNRLKQQSDVWDNLLLVILPDHGYCYGDMTVTTERYFRSPMVWTGGVVKKPMVVDVIMNQSDLPATLLGVLHFPYKDYRFSRNVLAASYKYQFAYCNTTELVMFRDTIGASFFNLKTLSAEDAITDSLRLLRLKAILQTSYDIVAP